MAGISAEEHQRQAQARKEMREKERREHWEMLFEGARDGHEKTQLLFDQRQENLYRRLDELEQGLRYEMHEQARVTRIWLVSLSVLVALLVLAHLWP